MHIFKKAVSILTVITFLCSNIAYADINSRQLSKDKKYPYQKLRVPVGQAVTQQRMEYFMSAEASNEVTMLADKLEERAKNSIAALKDKKVLADLYKYKKRMVQSLEEQFMGTIIRLEGIKKKIPDLIKVAKSLDRNPIVRAAFILAIDKIGAKEEAYNDLLDIWRDEPRESSIIIRPALIKALGLTKEEINLVLAKIVKTVPPIREGIDTSYSLEELIRLKESLYKSEQVRVNVYRLSLSLSADSNPELQVEAEKFLKKLSPEIQDKVNAMVVGIGEGDNSSGQDYGLSDALSIEEDRDKEVVKLLSSIKDRPVSLVKAMNVLSGLLFILATANPLEIERVMSKYIDVSEDMEIKFNQINKVLYLRDYIADHIILEETGHEARLAVSYENGKLVFKRMIYNASLGPNFKMVNAIPKAVETLKDRDLRGKNVLVRVNMNVRSKEGKITDAVRLDNTKEIVDFLLSKGATPILYGHNGRLDKKRGSDDRESLKNVANYLNTQLFPGKVVFHENSITEDKGLIIAKNDIVKGKINVVENVRLADNYELGSKRQEFAKAFMSLSDGILIFDAFGDVGSKGSSVEDVPLLANEVYVGPSMLKEFTELQNLIAGQGIDALVFGGAKLDKLPLLKNLLKGIKPGGVVLTGSGPSSSLKNDINLQKELNNIMPDGFLTAVDYKTRDGNDYDIGDKTTHAYLEKLDKLLSGKTVLVNGTMGYIEEPSGEFQKGTKAIFEKLRELADRGVKIVVIGGDAESNAKKYGLTKKQNIVTFSGGGVPLNILADENLVGLEALYKRHEQLAETDILEKSLGKLGFYILTQTTRKANDYTYDENTREFNIRGSMRHAINEQACVLKSVEALREAATAHNQGRIDVYKRAIARYGTVVRETYQSLKDDYRNADSSIEVLCNFLNSISDVIGSRHVGAGWGGNVIAWVEADKLPGVLSKAKDFIRSKPYRDALFSAGISQSDIDKKIKEVLASIQEYIPGPGAGVLISGNIDQLLKDLKNDNSEEVNKLKKTYGESEVEFKGSKAPYYKVEKERNITLLEEFKKQHPDAINVVVARSGGRVVLAGEHSDYHHGLVLNAPTLFDTLVIMAENKNNDNVTVSAMDEMFPRVMYDPSQLDIRNVSKDDLSGKEYYRYGAYTIHFLNEQIRQSTGKLVKQPGLYMMIDGRPEFKAVPVAAGISSSAALDVATSVAYLKIIGQDLTASQVTMASQSTENAIGFPCGAQDPFGAMRGWLPGAEEDKPYAQVMDCLPMVDKNGNPVIKAELVELPVNLRGILINTGTKSDRTQLEFSIRFDEGMIGTIMILDILKKGPKHKAFFAKFNNSGFIDDFIEKYYTNKDLGISIKPENTEAFPLFYKPFYLSLEELRRIGLDITEEELQQIIAELPDNISKEELENALGRMIYEDMTEMGGVSKENLDKVIDRLSRGTEKNFQVESTDGKILSQIKDDIITTLENERPDYLLDIFGQGLFVSERSI